MNTFDARLSMRDLALQALNIVIRLENGSSATLDDQVTLRRLTLDSRSLLVDAGYPGEAAWRGIQRASIGIDTQLSGADPGFWRDVQDDLQGGVDTLEALVALPVARDIDFRVVG